MVTLIRLVVGIVLAVGGLSACSGDVAEGERPSASGTPSGTAGSSPSGRCGDLLPDQALARLGWDVGPPAQEHAGRCERRVDGSGAMTVTTRAATGKGADEAGAALAAQCEELRADGGHVDQPVAWLEAGPDASCFTALAATRTGVAELYFVNAADEVVQVRLEALTPVEPERVERAMSEVATAAAELAP